MMKRLFIFLWVLSITYCMPTVAHPYGQVIRYLSDIEKLSNLLRSAIADYGPHVTISRDSQDVCASLLLGLQEMQSQRTRGAVMPYHALVFSGGHENIDMCLCCLAETAKSIREDASSIVWTEQDAEYTNSIRVALAVQTGVIRSKL